MKHYNIAIVGATGLVGSTVLSLLEERQFPVNKLYLLASHRSAGDTIDFKGKSYFVEDLSQFDFNVGNLNYGLAMAPNTTHKDVKVIPK